MFDKEAEDRRGGDGDISIVPVFLYLSFLSLCLSRFVFHYLLFSLSVKKGNDIGGSQVYLPAFPAPVSSTAETEANGK